MCGGTAAPQTGACHRGMPELSALRAGLIKSRPLDEWRETMAILCSFSTGEEWAGLCDALARR